jgi:hypothetical protein
MKQEEKHLDEAARELSKNAYPDKHNLIWMFKRGAKWQGEQISNEIKRIIDRAMNDEGRDLCNYIISFIENFRP